MKSILAAMLVLLCACGPSTAAHQMTPAQFTSEVAKRVRSADRNLDVEEIAPLELAIRGGKGGEQKMYLDNAYRSWRDVGAVERDEVLARYVRVSLAGLNEVPLARGQVMPMVKSRDWVQEAKRLYTDEAKPYDGLCDAWIGDLHVCHVQDRAESVSYLTQADLSRLGLDRAALRSLAIDNLSRLVPDIRVERGGLVNMVVADGSYEASLLLLEPFWKAELARVSGGLVVAVPARDLLLFADAANPRAVERLAELAGRASRESAYAISGQLFLRDASGLRTFAPD